MNSEGNWQIYKKKKYIPQLEELKIAKQTKSKNKGSLEMRLEQNPLQVSSSLTKKNKLHIRKLKVWLSKEITLT